MHSFMLSVILNSVNVLPDNSTEPYVSVPFPSMVPIETFTQRLSSLVSWILCIYSSVSSAREAAVGPVTSLLLTDLRKPVGFSWGILFVGFLFVLVFYLLLGQSDNFQASVPYWKLKIPLIMH